MNIFLASDNWLGEVKEMEKMQIFTTVEQPLPDLWNKVRQVVNGWMHKLNSKLKKAASSIRLNIGDYNK